MKFERDEVLSPEASPGCGTNRRKLDRRDTGAKSKNPPLGDVVDECLLKQKTLMPQFDNIIYHTAYPNPDELLEN